MNQKFFSAGFSLVELLAVIAIVSIIAAIATPTYLSYTKRAKLAEVFTFLAEDQTRLSKYLATNAMPTDQASANNMISQIGGLTVCHSQYVNACSFSQQGLTATIASSSNAGLSFNMSIYLLPCINSSGILEWACGYQSGLSNNQQAEAKDALPGSCNTVIQPLAGCNSTIW